MVGAGVLVAIGAVNSGAGLVKLATVASQQRVAAKRVPLEVTTQALPDEGRDFLSAKAWPVILKTLKSFKPDVLAVGPGLGTSKSVLKIVKNFISKTDHPMVLDADGLSAWHGVNNVKRKVPLIITPHPGELARILKTTTQAVQKDRVWAALEGAKKAKGVCLLKGEGTIITDREKIYKNPTGNPAMASGGMGDLLTGIIAALWGQMDSQNQETGFTAACLGAYLHGLAGDLATKKKGGLSLLATEVSQFLAQAIRLIRKGDVL